MLGSLISVFPGMDFQAATIAESDMSGMIDGSTLAAEPEIPQAMLLALQQSYADVTFCAEDYWADVPCEEDDRALPWTLRFARLASSHGWKIGSARYRSELHACFHCQLATDYVRVTTSVEADVLDLLSVHNYWVDFDGFKYDEDAHWRDNFNRLARTCKWKIGGELYLKEMRLCYRSHLLFDDGEEYDPDDVDEVSDAEDDDEVEGVGELEEFERALSVSRSSSRVQDPPISSYERDAVALNEWQTRCSIYRVPNGNNVARCKLHVRAVKISLVNYCARTYLTDGPQLVSLVNGPTQPNGLF